MNKLAIALIGAALSTGAIAQNDTLTANSYVAADLVAPLLVVGTLIAVTVAAEDGNDTPTAPQTTPSTTPSTR